MQRTAPRVKTLLARLRPQDLPLVFARVRRRAAETHVRAGPSAGARRWFAAMREAGGRLGAGLIDVRDVMGRLTLEEHIAKADRYFADAGWGTMHARKPFAEPLEAATLMRALAVLIPNLDLQPGLRLLDFGAGTCWSSLIWASLGCEVIATDVSAQALRFGEERVRADPIGRDLPIRFLRFDGRRFDLPDADVDRIVGIDTLHHVLDLPGTLRELERILAPGGIAAFSEPGPLHSLSPQSQHEMRTHGVIENDIRIEAVERAALAAGFAPLRVAWFTPEARLVDVRGFEQLTRGRVGGGEARAVLREVGDRLANVRIFFLTKAGDRTLTSKNREGLAAALSASLVRRDGRLVGWVRAQNTGRAVWLPSFSGRGEVNVGIQFTGRDGSHDLNFAHLFLSAEPVAPGAVVETTIDVACPEPGSLVVDLVAEGVTWFAGTGSGALTMTLA